MSASDLIEAIDVGVDLVGTALEADLLLRAVWPRCLAVARVLATATLAYVREVHETIVVARDQLARRRLDSDLAALLRGRK